MDASEYETEDRKNSCEWGKIALSPLSRKALYKNRLPCNKMLSSPTVGFRVILTVHCAEKLLKAEKQGDWKFEDVSFKRPVTLQTRPSTVVPLTLFWSGYWFFCHWCFIVTATRWVRHLLPNKRLFLVAWNIYFTFTVHSHLKALKQAAVLAAVALLAWHLAVFVPAAAVHALVADAALEEALAALAGDDAIVQACGAISTDKASTLVSWIICRWKESGHRRGFRAISISVFTVIHLKLKKGSGSKNLAEGTHF